MPRPVRSRVPALGAGLAFAMAIVFTPILAGEPSSNWPSFRGKDANGIGTGKVPASWDMKEGRNVLWKTAIPGLGHGGVVIWEDRIFVTTSISGKKNPKLKVGLYGDIASVKDDTVHRWQVFCLDKKSGRVLWQHTAHEGVPRVKRHMKASHANSTPATDGKRVIAFFGSEGLYAYDMEGKLLWQKDLGTLDAGFYRVPEAQWGFGSSPVLHQGRVIIQCDIQEGSFLAALDAATGRELWRTPRDEVPTWSTPAIVSAGDRTLVVVNGYRQIGGYDFATGRAVWSLRGGGDIPVPTPVASEGLVYITSAHGSSSPVFAIPVDATGELSTDAEAASRSRLRWSIERGGAYMQTPLVHDGILYVCRDNGVLTAYRADDGTRLYQTRLGGGSSGFTASPVLAEDRLYYTSEMGEVYVVKAGPTFELLGMSELDEIAMASPAISDGVIFFRTRDHVIAVGASPQIAAQPENRSRKAGR
ncbi:MAG: PQQ-binding-like beta-propeller repeat protein [Acidobacteria bacterium]|nr:PQQ-binding-like beta-propeller repeat protein [Acidobacteriota bacterium]